MAIRPSGTVTFLFTDIEGSTVLWEENPTTMRTVLTRHDEILRTAVAAHGGSIFATGGDGMAAAFQRSGDAVAAAVAAQRALQTEPWPSGLELRVRMGLHTGEAHERDGDYFGSPLNRAARLMAAAHGGQVVVSDVTASLLPSLPGVELVDLGSHALAGVKQTMRVHAVRADGLTWLDRPLRTTMRGNLSNPVTPWFGPTGELQRRARALVEHRLVTLAGTGGVGKTRLAIEIGGLVADEFGDGVWLAELAPLGDPEAVASAIASTLDVRPREGMTLIDSVVDALRSRRVLLIVDNCEHVLGAVVEVLGPILGGCPQVTVLATSREPLGINGEHIYRVPSLPVSDAVELFCERAVAADDALTFGAADVDLIARICERLDGIPLGIELAAARSRSLAPAELLARLDDRFRLLRGSARGGLERHQTLRATVDWSYQLLTDAERLLFDRLSVFAGTFDLTSTEAVCDGDMDTLDVLSALIDKSMVIADRAEGGTRYHLLETLRQFGEERLDQRGELGARRDRHLRHFVDVAARADRLFQSPLEPEGVAILEREWDNLRAAHSWAIATDLAAADELLWSLTLYAGFRARAELGEWVERTIAATNGRPRSAATAGIAAYWAYVAGETERAVLLARAGIEQAADPDAPTTTWCWTVLTSISDRTDDSRAFGEATTHYERAATAASVPLGVVLALDRRAQWASISDRAFLPQLLDRLDALVASIGSPTAEAIAMSARARSALGLGDAHGALDAFQRCREFSHRHGV
ncbi:MAG: hypothetical protein QOG69_2802, partial [Actinomycetota bacterium]|nr:hypothetical protein [Actinomycetota bacterium]